MAIPQEPNAVFYHPLDGTNESTQAAAWRGRATHPSGTVGQAMGPQPGGFSLTRTDDIGTPGQGFTDRIEVAPLTAATALVVWYKSSLLYAVVCSVNGDGIIAMGTQVSWNASDTDFAVAGLDDTTVVVMHNRSGASGVGRVLTVAGAGVTVGGEWAGVATSFSTPSAGRLDSTRFVVAWSDSGNAKAAAGTVAGTDVTFGAHAATGGNYNGGIMPLAVLNSTKFVLGWGYSPSNQSYMVVGDIAGPFNNTVTFGSIRTVSDGSGTVIGPFAALDSETIVMYGDGAGWCVCRVSGTEFTFGPQQSNPEGDPEGNPVLRRLSGDSALLVEHYGERGYTLRIDGYEIEFGPLADTGPVSATNLLYGVAVLEPSSLAVVAAASEPSGSSFVAPVSLTGHAAYRRHAGAWGPDHTEVFYTGGGGATNPANYGLVAIDADRTLLTYDQGSANPTGMARVVTAAWGDIPVAAAPETISGEMSSIRTAMLDANTAVACWREYGGGEADYGFARLLAVSGDTVSVSGTRVPFRASADTQAVYGVVALGSSQFAVAWRYSGGPGLVSLATVSGSDITFAGPPVEFVSAATEPVRVAPIDSSSFVVAYDDAGVGRARVGVLAGGAVSFGPAVAFSGDLSYLSLAPLGSGSLAVTYVESPGLGEPVRTKIATIAGSDITFGSAVQVVENMYTDGSVGPLSVPVTGGVAVMYRDQDQANAPFVRTAAVAGGAAQFGPPASWPHGTQEQLAVASLADGERVVQAYRSGNDGTTTVFRAAVDLYPTAVGPLPKVVFSKWYVGAEAPPPATTTVPPITTTAPPPF